MNCVESMQKKAEILEAPYEVLIQGPTGSRFVRGLLTESQVADPKKRSTISVYQPARFTRSVDENKDTKDVTPEESAPAAEADKTKDATEDAKETVPAVEEVKAEEAAPKADEKPAENEKPNAEEKAKREVDNKDAAKEEPAKEEPAKEDAKSDDSEKANDEAAEKSKTEESVEPPKETESADKPKDDESAEKNTEAEKDGEKKLKKRDADSELQEALAEANKEAEASDVEKSDANKDTTPTTEPSVGIALPPVLGLKLLPLQLGALNLGALKTNFALQKGKFTFHFFFLFQCTHLRNNSQSKWQKSFINFNEICLFFFFLQGALIDAKLLPLKTKLAALKAKFGLPILVRNL